MILQSIIFQGDPCPKEEVYFRSSHGQIMLCEDSQSVRMGPGARLDTYSYMNLFDAGLWSKISGITDYFCRVKLQGKATLCLWTVASGKKRALDEQKADLPEAKEVQIPFHIEGEGIVYLTIEAESELLLYGVDYEADCHPAQIHISLVICTYKRQEALRHIIDVLKGSHFFLPDSSYYGKMSVRIVDNGQEMSMQPEGFLKVFPNRNEGGSGGFARGMAESREDEKKYGITHVVMMDDDVDIIPETFYRLYALLSVMKAEYQQEVIAGRMFRLDQPQVQYTAAEIWNKGQIRHVGFLEDMADPASLQGINDCDGEYTGWWFACFPMKYVRENDPIPFFLHCDDVEYGLRHGGIPIILNGIQVWHETADRRQNPRIDYYDTRNAMIVNHLLGMPQEEIERLWFQKITDFHIKGEILSEYMAIRGMEDFLKGESWLRRIDGGKLNDRLSRIKENKWMRYINAIRWRMAMRKSKKKPMYFWTANNSYLKKSKICD